MICGDGAPPSPACGGCWPWTGKPCAGQWEQVAGPGHLMAAIDHGADYILTVKGNQPTLRTQLRALP